MDENMELIVMNLVVDSGSGRSFAMEAIQYAKEGNFEEAEKSLESADKELIKAHGVQSQLIRDELSGEGEGVKVNLMLVHSQDHLMTSMLCKDLAREFVDLYKKIK